MTGDELKHWRTSLGLSVAQASRQVEVGVRTWTRWESGKKPIPAGAIKLFELLNPKKTGS